MMIVTILCVIAIFLSSWCILSAIQYGYYWFFQKEREHSEIEELLPFPNGKYYNKSTKGKVIVQFQRQDQTFARIYQEAEVEFQKGRQATLQSISITPIISKFARWNLFYPELQWMSNQAQEKRIIIVTP